MEVGDQRIYATESMARRDEQPRPAAPSRSTRAAQGGALERTHRRGSDDHGPAAAAPGSGDRRSCPAAHLGPLSVHLVSRYPLDANGANRVRADVKRNELQSDAGRAEAREQPWREMEPGGWRRSGARSVPVNGLVA